MSAFGRVRQALLFGLFVFLFLLLFQPFGLSGYTGSLLLLTAGYGLTCSVVMLILNVLIVPLFPLWFSEETWTAGKESIWTLANISLIGLANLLYSSAAGVADFSSTHLLRFEFFTIAVAVFPVLFSVLLRTSRLETRYRKKSEELNEKLDPGKSGTEVLLIPSETEKEQLSLSSEQLLYMQSAGNYTEVFYREEDVVKKKLLRNSLKNLTGALSGHQILFRCHKSYLVNLGQVEKISGNAQGYRLHLRNSGATVPVSRNLNGQIQSLLSTKNSAR